MTVHSMTIKRIMRYLEGKFSLGLRMSKSNSTIASAFPKPIKQVALMARGLQGDLVCSLNRIWSSEVKGKKLQFLGTPLKLNTRPRKIQLLMLFMWNLAW